MVPIWSRAHRFANVYAFAFLDFSSIFLWLSAWAAVASYVSSGKGKGGSKDKNATGCDNFSHGTATKCKLSEASVFLGVVIMLTFCFTAFVSAKAVMEYKRTGIAPATMVNSFYSGKQNGAEGHGGLGGMKPTNPMEEQNDAFDARMNFDRDDYDDPHGGQDPRQSLNTAYAGAGAYGYASVHQDEDLGGRRPTSLNGPLY